MRKLFITFSMAIIAITLFSGCSVMSRSMKEPSNNIQFQKNDFEYSDQVSGEATEVKILGVDWARLFGHKMGELQNSSNSFNIPIIGGLIGNKVNGYALYNVMLDNPGYDIVLYPQYETSKTNLIITKITKVKVTARLGKIKK